MVEDVRAAGAMGAVREAVEAEAKAARVVAGGGFIAMVVGGMSMV